MKRQQGEQEALAQVLDYPPMPDFDTVEQHIYGACRRYITQDMLEPIHNLIRDAIDADRAARAPAGSVTAPAGGVVAGWLPVHSNGHKFYGAPLKTEVEAKQYINQVHQSSDSVTLIARPFSWIATPPTQTEDGVLEEAALLLESQHTWLTNVAAANLLRSLAARKQGANHDKIV